MTAAPDRRPDSAICHERRHRDQPYPPKFRTEKTISQLVSFRFLTNGHFPREIGVADLRFCHPLTGQRKCPYHEGRYVEPKEQARLSVLNSVLEYQVPIVQAAEVLGVSPRHARRLLAAYRQDGATALAHGNRGRRPHNAIPSAEAAAVVELATGRYEGANHTHLTELLSEREGIDLSRPTVRRILAKAGIGSPRSRRSPQHRFRRQRMPQAGMLLQLDGSHHAWLEDRGTKFALLLAVDDATSAVVSAVFCISENTAGYFTLLEGLIERWGIPLALYSDRHAVFKHNARKPETAAEATQFTRSLQELGIRQIFARSPQAKGRVERAAGTFQDRLVTELRLSDARTMDQATAVLQDFLPRYNARFAVQPEHPEPAYRPADPDLILSEILCFKDTRKVGRDNTVKYHWRVLQLLPDRGAHQLRRTAGGGAGTTQRPTHRQVRGPSRGHPGTTAAHGRPVGGCHRLVPWP